MRRARRVDANHGELIAAFRKLGCSVLDMSGLGDGAPDILVCFGGVSCFLIEIKDGAKPPSKRCLTPDEERWHADWKGPVKVVKNIDEVVECVDLMKRWHAAVWAATKV